MARELIKCSARHQELVYSVTDFVGWPLESCGGAQTGPVVVRQPLPCQVARWMAVPMTLLALL